MKYKIAIFLTIITLLISYYFKYLINENQRLNIKIMQLQVGNRQLLEQLNHNYEAIIERDKFRQNQLEEYEKKQKNLEEIYEKDDTVYNWSHNSIPDNIYQLLRQ